MASSSRRGRKPPRGPRPDLLRRRQAEDRLRLRFQQRGGDRAPAGRQDRRGRHQRSLGGDFALARYNPDGSLDTSFSGDGKQTTDFGGARRGERGGAPGRRQDRRGRRAGAATSFADFALARYNPNGSLDTSFSGDGKQTTDFGGFDAGDSGVAIQANGKIVAVGGEFGRGGDFALARYNPNGSLDTSFSGDGKQTTDFGGGFDGANGVALQARRQDRRGRAATPAAPRLRARPLQPQRLARHELLRRRQADDRLLGGFDGRTGWRSRATARSSRSATAASADDFALARYNPNGSLDTSFSGDGKQTTDFGGFDEANGVALQGDGKIVAVGRASAGDDFALARYNPNGSLDTSFSGDGKQTTDFGGSDEANGVALQGDGKIVAVGSRRRRRRLRARPLQPQRLARHELLRRRQADDRLRGRRRGDRGGAPGGRQDRRGRPRGGTTDDFALARYNPNGSLDTSFSGDGKQTTDFGGSFDRGERGGAPERRQDRRGRAVRRRRLRLRARPLQPQRLARHELLRRRQADDRLRGGDDGANGVALQANGKIVVVGSIANGPAATSPSPATTRTARSTRASPATASRRPTSGAPTGRTAVALQADGKIVAVGDGVLGPGDDFALARYNPNGSLDTSFSGDGKQTTDFGGSDGANGVALQATARSSRSAATVGPAATSRSPATTPTARSTRASPATASRRPTSAGLRPGERGGAPGRRQDRRGGGVGGAGDDFALARYNPNGSLDPSFSGDGKQTTDFGGADGGARGGAPGERQDRRGRGRPRTGSPTISRLLAIWGAESAVCTVR